MSERIEQILSMLESEPTDVFLHYSLAMEYASAKRFHEAVEEFYKCIELDANYLAAYVEAGKCLRSAGRLAEAREMFKKGMDLAAAQGQDHTRDFIRQQIESLPSSQ